MSVLIITLKERVSQMEESDTIDIDGDPEKIISDPNLPKLLRLSALRKIEEDKFISNFLLNKEIEIQFKDYILSMTDISKIKNDCVSILKNGTSDFSVRILLAKYINDQETLKQIGFDINENFLLREIAIRHITNQVYLVDVLLNDPHNMLIFHNVVDRIDDFTQLSRIIISDNVALNIKLRVLDKINDLNTLYKLRIAVKDDLINEIKNRIYNLEKLNKKN